MTKINHKNNRHINGFTIIELLVVIVIIGILASISIVSYNGIRSKAIITSLQSDLINSSDQLVIDQARNSAGTFPTSLAQADGGAGVTSTPNTTYQYTVNNTNTPKTFCLTATNSSQNYFITQEGTPLPGPCPALYLDAGIKTSYPGTGNLWTDLSGNGNNGVLAGNVSYSSSDGGSLSFDGIDDSATVTNNSSLNFSSAQTVMVVMKHSFVSGRKVIWDQAYGGYGTWTHESGDVISQFFGNAGANGDPYIGIASASTPRNAWNFICATRDTSNHKWYINGNLSNTTPNPYGTLASTAADIRIGTGYAGYWQGNISIVMAYKTALTSSEVSQIFNALRARFGA